MFFKKGFYMSSLNILFRCFKVNFLRWCCPSLNPPFRPNQHTRAKLSIILQRASEKTMTSNFYWEAHRRIFDNFALLCWLGRKGGSSEGEHHLEKLDDDVVWTPSNWTTLGHNILLVATKSFYSCYCYTHSTLKMMVV